MKKLILIPLLLIGLFAYSQKIISVPLTVESTATFEDDVTCDVDLSARTAIYTPEVAQNITAVGNTILSTATHIELNPDADYVMTSTPTIQAGTDGQILFIHNISAFTLSLQDDAILAGSDIFLGGAESTIKPSSTMMLHYNDDAGGGWSVISNPNSAAAGANADILEVRNQSGVAIAAGKVVYASGYNIGQNRVLIALADADDPTKMPAIGITSAAIGNGANGDVITTGTVTGLINTVGTSVNDGVWVSTTAGEVVFTRPTVDAIQRIAIVTRVNANGNVLVQGAGRSNDIPINITMNDGSAIRTGLVDDDNLIFQAVDNDPNTYTTVAQLTGASTPTFDLVAGRATGTFNANSQDITNIASMDASGTVSFTGTVVHDGGSAFVTNSADIEIAKDEDDLDVGLEIFLRLDNTKGSSANITGMVANVANMHFYIVNTSAQNIVLKHQDASSGEGNRFLFSTGADITLAQNGTIHIIYDGTTGRWRDF